MALSEFAPNLVEILLKYGTQEDDGRHALEAVLAHAKVYVGKEQIAECERLIQELRLSLKILHQTLSSPNSIEEFQEDDSFADCSLSSVQNPTESVQPETTQPQNSTQWVLFLLAIILLGWYGIKNLGSLPQHKWLTSDSSLMIFAVALILFSLTARFYLTHARHFNQEYPALSDREFHWLIWPAIGANYFFERLFGKRPVRFTLTKRSLAELQKLNAELASDLQSLQGIEYANDLLFVNALEAKLGTIQAKKYNALIRHHAEQRTRARDLFTWRSVGATLLVSLLANSICVIYILLFFPDDVPPFEPHLLRILGLSYIAFICFNFMGGPISVSFTRHGTGSVTLDTRFPHHSTNYAI